MPELRRGQPAGEGRDNPEKIKRMRQVRFERLWWLWTQS
jgi:hypothetical protein